MTLVQLAIIDHLRKNTAVQTLLGFSVDNPDGVFEEATFNTDEVAYPRITVGITSEVFLPVEQVRDMAGKRSSTVLASLNIFSKQSSSLEVGAIDMALRTALESVPLDYTGLCVYDCEMDSLVQKLRDVDTGIWHCIIRYKLIVRPL